MHIKLGTSPFTPALISDKVGSMTTCPPEKSKMYQQLERGIWETEQRCRPGKTP